MSITKAPATNASGFVADGGRRYQREALPHLIVEITAAVRLEYAERLSQAGVVGRWRLERQICAEVRRRVKERSPSEWALY